jgi:hypothetical protein
VVQHGVAEDEVEGPVGEREFVSRACSMPGEMSVQTASRTTPARSRFSEK